ncbi:MAG: hypothetical protein HQL32_06170, partial [Planctomycetes bacterium]|nr:hypothetical protein [Planctomycetota bacterium]
MNSSHKSLVNNMKKSFALLILIALSTCLYAKAPFASKFAEAVSRSEQIRPTVKLARLRNDIPAKYDRKLALKESRSLPECQKDLELPTETAESKTCSKRKACPIPFFSTKKISNFFKSKNSSCKKDKSCSSAKQASTQNQTKCEVKGTCAKVKCPKADSCKKIQCPKSLGGFAPASPLGEKILPKPP